MVREAGVGDAVRKVLIVANMDHAYPRLFAWGTYLPDAGWEATIVTAPMGRDVRERLGFPPRFLARVNIVEAPYRGDVFWLWRRVFASLGFRTNESITEQLKERFRASSRISVFDVLMRCYQSVFAYPDTERTWRRAALKVAGRVLEAGTFDAIVSSSPFPTSHIVAAGLKRRFGLPWCADFRDPWTQNQNYPYGRVRRWIEERLERRTLSAADALTAAIPLAARTQQQFHKEHVALIANGFDPDDINEPPLGLTSKFTVTYTGSIYVGKQDPEKMLTAFERLIRSGVMNRDDVELRFYGRRQSWLEREIQRRNLIGVVSQYGPVSRREAVLKQRESHVLLHFNWEDMNKRGWYPLKFFEYLAARRPILACGGFPEDDFAQVLRKTKAGTYAVTVGDIEVALLHLYREYREHGHVSFTGDVEQMQEYSYPEVTKRFAEVLNNLVGA